MDERQAVNFHAGAGRGWDLAAPRSRGWETPGILSPPPHLPEHLGPTGGLETCVPQSHQLVGRPWLGAPQAPECKEGGGGSPRPRSAPLTGSAEN